MCVYVCWYSHPVCVFVCVGICVPVCACACVGEYIQGVLIRNMDTNMCLFVWRAYIGGIHVSSD